MNPLQLIQFVEANLPESDRLNALALLADAPPDDYAPTMRLPVQNELPAFKVGDNGLGASLANLDYGVAAPVIGQAQEPSDMSIGELLTGEF